MTTETRPSLSERDSATVVLQRAAAAIADPITEEYTKSDYTSALHNLLRLLNPELGSKPSDTQIRFYSAVELKDRGTLVGITAKNYIAGKVAEGEGTLSPSEVAYELDAFALELQRVGVYFTHAGATGSVMRSLIYTRNYNLVSGADTGEINRALEQLQSRRRRHLGGLIAKSAGVLATSYLVNKYIA